MTTPALLNFAELLAPIAGDSGAGIDLRADRGPASLYDKVREARMAARDAERRTDQGFETGDSGLNAWRTILDTAPVILATESKDLEIASMLTEGLLRFHGLAGLRDGFRLIRELVDAFWDHLYPMPDDDGMLTRLAPIINLWGEEQGADGTLVQPVRRVAITQAGDAGPLTLAHYEQAKRLAGVSDEVRAQRINAGNVTLETIAASAALTPRTFFTEFLADLDQSIDEHRQLVASLDRAAGRDAPSGASVSALLAELREALLTIAPFLAEVPAPAEAAPPGETDRSAGGTPAAGMAEAVSGREEALALLLRVADYFRRAEPQSTIPYVLEELVRRGRLSLTELLQELIEDQGARRQFYVKAGIRPPESV